MESNNAITDQIHRDHFSDNFAHRTTTRKMDQFQRNHIKPFFETRLLLSEIQSLISDPDRSKVLTEEEKKYIENVLFRPISSEPPHRRYAEQVFGLTENDLQVAPMQIKSKLNHQIDLALKEKYQQVYDLVSVYQEPPSNKNGSNNSNNDSNSDNNHNNDDDIVQLVQENQRALTRMRVQLPAKRELLNKLITRFVKITLEVLDTVWAIIREFKCDDEEKKNASFDAYYCALTDSLLLRIKILHISTLLSTYDSDLVSALQSLRTILENRYLDARTQLSFAEKKIQAYQDMGPEFETLADAYFKLLEDIKATEDDIRRIKNN